MSIHQSDVIPVEMPEDLFASRLRDMYDFRLLPGGLFMGNGERCSGVRAELSWRSHRTGAPLRFEIQYSVSCSQSKVWVSRTDSSGLAFYPYTSDHKTFDEFCNAFREADVEAAVQSRKLELGRYELLRLTQMWHQALSADHLPGSRSLSRKWSTTWMRPWKR